MGRQSAKEEEMGTRKYRDMIHKSAKKTADNPNLMFKPVPFDKLRSGPKIIKCDVCGSSLIGTRYTYMIFCNNCKSFVKVDSGYVR